MPDDEIIRQYKRKIHDLGYRPYILENIEFMIHKDEFEKVIENHHETLQLLTQSKKRLDELGSPIFIETHTFNGVERLIVE